MSKDKKIGVLGLRGFPHVMGGVERHCEHLYPKLAQQGFAVTVCRRTPYLSDLSRAASYPGIEFLDIWTPRHKHIEALLHSAFSVLFLRLKGVRILHIHSFGPGIVAPLARLLGQKVVLTYHLPNYMQGKWGRVDRFLLRAAERMACRWANEIVAVSKNNERIVKENTGRRSTVIPNGITPPTTDRHSVNRFGLKKGHYIFAACRFVPEKGLHTLIEAFQRIDTKWTLVIAGDADHPSEYSERLKRMAAQNSKILMPGFVSGVDLEGLFACAGLFVLPSHIEGLPIALLEAMSFGVPVVVSDIPPHRDVPVDEDAFFAPGDAEGLAERLRFAVENGDLRKRAREKQQMIAERYNWDTIAHETAELFGKVCLNGRRDEVVSEVSARG